MEIIAAEDGVGQPGASPNVFERCPPSAARVAKANAEKQTRAAEDPPLLSLESTPGCLVCRFATSPRLLHCLPLLYNTVIISLNHIVIHCGFCLRLPKLPLHISAAIKPIKPLVVKWSTVVDAGAGRNCVIPYCG
ncbi:Hypothetical predicted protein [Podarcis lilfordi]|uniref:Uncharacterized protein n=1 Tax=Podarcis lilfordi TaxID=74358 RepID=A0AA35P0U1_9SAUR|nr:Hypothetical predicted protein [Podarcis lilfordi]